LTLDRGGRGTVVVKVVRRNYTGAIQLTAEGVLPGITVSEGAIAAGQNQSELAFQASLDAANSASFVRIYGTADISGKKVTRQAEQPVIFASMSAGAVAQHNLDAVAIAVSGQGAELALRGEAVGPVAPGGKTRVKLSVRRREGIKGEVTIKAVSLPSGFSLPETKIADGKDSAEIDLAANSEVRPGKRSLQLEGSLRIQGRNTPILAAAPLVVDVQPLLTLELTPEQVDVTQGGKATVEIRIDRNSTAATPIELEFSRLPNGITVGPERIPGDAKTFKLQIEAAKDASASPVRRIVQIQPKAKIGSQTLELPTLRFALKVTAK
jgi:hypothetical protein